MIDIEKLEYYLKRLEEALKYFEEVSCKSVNWAVGYCFDCDEIIKWEGEKGNIGNVVLEKCEEHKKKGHFVVVEFDTMEMDESPINEISAIKKFIEWLLKLQS